MATTVGQYCIYVSDIERSIRFYTEIIGLTVGPRPAFPFPGLWLYNGEPPADLNNAESNYGIVHVMGVDPHDPQGLIETVGYRDPDTLTGSTGGLDHIALAVTGRAAMLEKLNTLNRHQFEKELDPEIESRIAQYEMAFRMQTSVPDVTNLASESDSTFKLYGPDSRTPGSLSEKRNPRKSLVNPWMPARTDQKS